MVIKGEKRRDSQQRQKHFGMLRVPKCKVNWLGSQIEDNANNVDKLQLDAGKLLVKLRVYRIYCTMHRSKLK